MIIPYDPYANSLFNEFLDMLMAARCRYLASDLMAVLEYRDVASFAEAIAKAKRACTTMDIPVRFHFREVYISEGYDLYRDDLLSEFACYLTTMNADPSLPAVAQAQVFFLRRR